MEAGVNKSFFVVFDPSTILRTISLGFQDPPSVLRLYGVRVLGREDPPKKDPIPILITLSVGAGESPNMQNITQHV